MHRPTVPILHCIQPPTSPASKFCCAWLLLAVVAEVNILRGYSADACGKHTWAVAVGLLLPGYKRQWPWPLRPLFLTRVHHNSNLHSTSLPSNASGQCQSDQWHSPCGKTPNQRHWSCQLIKVVPSLNPAGEIFICTGSPSIARATSGIYLLTCSPLRSSVSGLCGYSGGEPFLCWPITSGGQYGTPVRQQSFISFQSLHFTNHPLNFTLPFTNPFTGNKQTNRHFNSLFA